MLRFIFLALLCSLLLLACGMHNLFPENAEDESLDSSASNYRSSSDVVYLSSSSSSLPLSSSSSSSLPSSSSSSEEEFSSSSSVDGCDFNVNSMINAECFYSETVTISDEKIIGQNAKLSFADNASLRVNNATLNIAGGAELYFGKNSELNISNWSTLNIAGSVDKPVIFAAADETKPWVGIKNLGRNASIDYADLSGAAIGIEFSRGDAVLKNSKIHDNEYGMQMYAAFGNGNISGNRFYENVYDAQISLDVASTLGAASQFTGKLHISEADNIIDEVFLPAFDYFFDKGFRVGGNTEKGYLEIEAGARFYFSKPSEIIIAYGEIQAVGTSDKPIIFDNAAFILEAGCGGTSKFRFYEINGTGPEFSNYCGAEALDR
jgi:hypothetical protein